VGGWVHNRRGGGRRRQSTPKKSRTLKKSGHAGRSSRDPRTHQQIGGGEEGTDAPTVSAGALRGKKMGDPPPLDYDPQMDQRPSRWGLSGTKGTGEARHFWLA